MKDNAIFILVDCNDSNIVYQDIIPMVKKCCREYFGNKHFWEGPECSPICYTNEVISQEDIDNILDLVSNSSIRLYGLNNFVINNLRKGNIFTFPTDETK